MQCIKGKQLTLGNKYHYYVPIMLAISVRVHMFLGETYITVLNDIQEGINSIANAQKQFDHAAGLPQCTGV